MSFRMPRMRSTLAGLIGVAAIALLAPTTAFADHFEASTKTCGALHPETGLVNCTLIIDIDDFEGTGVPATDSIFVDILNRDTTGSRFVSAEVTGSTCPGTTTTSILNPPTSPFFRSRLFVNPEGLVDDCTITVSEVLSATSTGQVCQVVDTSSGANAAAAFVCADILAPPTLEDQCKNGGWETFRIFKNQGDCVAFVQTNAQNPPSGPPKA